jgi:hypothetical protein
MVDLTEGLPTPCDSAWRVDRTPQRGVAHREQAGVTGP